MSNQSWGRAGIVGLGRIGGALAECLVTRGVRVVACDRDLGARGRAGTSLDVVESPAAVADRVRPAPVLVVVRSDDVAEVLYGTGGIAKAGGTSTVAVVSTVHPTAMRDLAARAAAKKIAVVDAPVSGGAARARDGTLTTLVSGPAPVLEMIDPIVRRFSASVHSLGHEVGQAQAAKLVNQFLMGIGLVSVAEGMRLATELGLDDETLRPVLADGTASSWVLEHWPRLRQYWETAGAAEEAVALVAHDLEMVLDEAEARGLELPVGRLACARFDRPTPV